MTAFSFRAAGRLAAGGIGLFAFCVACAEGTTNEQLSESTLSGAGLGATDPTAGGGSGGSMATTGGGGGGGMPAASGTGGSMPAASGTGGTVDGGSGGSGGSASGGGGSGGAAGMSGGGMGGSAGNGGNAGSAGSGGGTAGYRYAKFVATSEQAGKVWSSCAELNIMTTGGATIVRGDWGIFADSQETNNETAPAAAAIDGDPATFWHTSWEPAPDDVNDAKLPHSLTIDLKSPQTITGFSYLPRQTGINGRVKDWEFYVSKDGVAWGTAVKKGTFPDGTALQTETF